MAKINSKITHMLICARTKSLILIQQGANRLQTAVQHCECGLHSCVYFLQRAWTGNVPPTRLIRWCLYPHNRGVVRDIRDSNWTLKHCIRQTVYRPQCHTLSANWQHSIQHTAKTAKFPLNHGEWLRYDVITTSTCPCHLHTPGGPWYSYHFVILYKLKPLLMTDAWCTVKQLPDTWICHITNYSIPAARLRMQLKSFI